MLSMDVQDNMKCYVDDRKSREVLYGNEGLLTLFVGFCGGVGRSTVV